MQVEEMRIARTCANMHVCRLPGGKTGDIIHSAMKTQDADGFLFSYNVCLPARLAADVPVVVLGRERDKEGTLKTIYLLQMHTVGNVFSEPIIK